MNGDMQNHYRADMTGAGVVVMANGDRGNELALEIARGVARELSWPAFEARVERTLELGVQDLERFAGAYHFAEAEFSVAISRVQDHLVLSTPRETCYTLYPIAAQRFIAVEDAAVATFAILDFSTVLELWGMRAERSI